MKNAKAVTANQMLSLEAMKLRSEGVKDEDIVNTFKERGIVSPRSGKPYTRSGVLYLLHGHKRKLRAKRRKARAKMAVHHHGAVKVAQPIKQDTKLAEVLNYLLNIPAAERQALAKLMLSVGGVK